MSFTATITALCAGALLAFVFCVAYTAHKRQRQPLPPGPRGIPIFGNLFQLPTLRPHPKLLEWAHKYGEIYSLKLGGQDVVVLNTAEAANEILSRRSLNYATRTSGHVAHDILHDGMGLALLAYAPPWKTLRSALQSVLGPGPSKRLRQYQEYESRVFLYDMVCHGDEASATDAPEGLIAGSHWYAPVRRFATSIAVYILYGKRVNRFLDNPDLHQVYDIVNNFVEMALPGHYLVDVFPILKWLPDFLASWRVKARKLHFGELGLWRTLLSECKVSMNNDTRKDSFVHSYLTQRAAAGEEIAPGKQLTESGWMQDDFLAYGAGSTLEAGSDTTTSSIVTFILCMLSHPHALQRARAEIDQVVGLDRLPEFDDEGRLPYFMACLKESLRLRPATLIALPHAAIEDDTYKGYHIPKGCTVIGNVWAIHRDPERFFNPAAFVPERFYQDGEPTHWDSGPKIEERSLFMFGWGRRFCPGSYIAEASLFITLSRLLWGVDFSAPVNSETGRPILPDVADEEKTWRQGLISLPNAFDVRFVPRSAKHAELIHKAFDDVQADWRAMGLEEDER